jgi:hypothetical protein
VSVVQRRRDQRSVLEGTNEGRASWFETALARLLTMRVQDLRRGKIEDLAANMPSS